MASSRVPVSNAIDGQLMATVEADIDRIVPTICPPGREVMRQSWRKLLFLHWSVPESVLRPLVPPELTIDTFEGRAYLGLIPFTMFGIRPLWSPAIPGISEFHEINLRTYVHVNGADPGVWFFSLDAANLVGATLGRSVWRLPYHFARMRIIDELDLSGSASVPRAAVNGTGGASVPRADLNRTGSASVWQGPDLSGSASVPRTALNGTTRYTSTRLGHGPLPGEFSVRYRPTGSPFASKPGTLNHFLIERYYLYAKARGRLYRGQVYHTPYNVQSAALEGLQENIIAAAGIDRGDESPIVHYSVGVDVKVYPLQKVKVIV